MRGAAGPGDAHLTGCSLQLPVVTFGLAFLLMLLWVNITTVRPGLDRIKLLFFLSHYLNQQSLYFLGGVEDFL